MDQRCGSCAFFRPSAPPFWAAAVPRGTCTFTPAPAALRDRGVSANEGRACPVFRPAQEPDRAC